MGSDILIIYPIFRSDSISICGWGLGAFLRGWPPSAMWVGPLIFYDHHQGCLNNPIFSNLGLCPACSLWTTFVSHPFSFLNSSLGLAGGKHYQKITIPIFRLLQNFAIPGYFPYIILYSYPFPLLSSGWFVIAVCGSASARELVKSPTTCWLNGCPHFLFLF